MKCEDCNTSSPMKHTEQVAGQPNPCLEVSLAESSISRTQGLVLLTFIVQRVSWDGASKLTQVVG